MTEEEAKQRWCPFVRVDVFDGGNHHLYEINDKCRGSECMAFRWITNPNKKHPDNPHPCTGYCGLAGKP